MDGEEGYVKQSDDQEEQETILNEWEKEEELAERYTITLNSISNFSSNQTLKYKGVLKDIPILALIDIGVTHSFIHHNLVNELQLATIPVKPLFVRVATGPRAISNT